MKWYRVIFEFKGKPLKGWNVSDKMPFEMAKHYAKQIKESGYEPELLEIKEV